MLLLKSHNGQFHNNSGYDANSQVGNKSITFATILYIFLFCTFAFHVYAQPKFDYLFKQFSTNEGLSQYDVSCIIQDKKGFYWIGTYGGLNCYDGYQNTVFEHLSGKISCLSGNRVVSLETDSSDLLWIGVEQEQISILNLRDNKFMNIKYLFPLSNSIPFSVISFRIIGEKEIFAGTTDGDLYRIRYELTDIRNDSILLIPEKISINLNNAITLRYLSAILPYAEHLLLAFRTGGLIQIKYPDNHLCSDGNIIEPGGINCLFLDSKENLWIGTFSGLQILKLLKGRDKFINITPKISEPLIQQTTINSFAEDLNHNIWISTYTNGLFVCKSILKYNGNIVFTNYNKSNSLLSTNKLSCLFLDRSNSLWVGTHQDGLQIADLSQKKFYTITTNKYGAPKNEIFISSVFEDNRNNLWVGTEGDGLYRFDSTLKKFLHWQINDFQNYSNSVITRLYQDVQGNIWFCSWHGVYYLPWKGQIDSSLRFIYSNSTILTNIAFYSLIQDEYQNYWAASNTGLYRFKMDNKGLKDVSKVNCKSENTNKGLSDDWINCLEKGQQNTVWAGTHGYGMFKITYGKNLEDISVEQYSFQEKNNFFLSNDIVWCILFKEDTLWVGTDEGLNQYALKSNSEYVFKNSFNSKDGLKDNKVVSIIDDKDDNLWLGTGNGLLKLLKNRSTFINYSYDDGLQNNCFTTAALKSPSGYLFFGGIKGLNYFLPEEILESNNKPITELTELIISNEPINPGTKINGQVVLKDNIFYARNIHLKYNNNNITLKFSALNFGASKTSNYSYILEGFDTRWINIPGSEHSATYSNLPAGKYTFKVISSNTDGKWQSYPTTLTIFVGRKPWETWWAYTSYMLVVILIISFLFRYYKNKIKLEHEIILERNMRKNENEITKLKMNFYSNISHELRTPLTLIMSPVSEIKKLKIENKTINDLVGLLAYNCEKLLRLINQLLDFNKIDENDILLNLKKSDIIAFLQKIYLSFGPLASQKKIHLSFSSEIPEYFVSFDHDVIDKILSNIVLNSIKYTPEDGILAISFNVVKKINGEFFIIDITDSGIGIEDDKIDKVFEKYYHNESGQGYGIGLYFVKELVLRHQGTISVRSRLGVGTSVCIEFPSFDSAYAKGIGIKTNVTITSALKSDLRNESFEELRHSSKKRSELILIVEDDDDLRDYLSGFFSREYNVLNARNGAEGLETAIEFLPDVIIADIVMPKMDGMELLKSIRQNNHTDHIPFIIITAKGGINNELRGIDSGAEDFIEKPFDVEILQKKVSNLLNIIKVTREKQRQKFLFEPQETKRTIETDDFLAKAAKLVNENISNPRFDATYFSSEMAVSRMQLHRKLKVSINMSAGEFIRSIKMKRAAELLKTGKYNVSEVMFEVGFDNSSYFAKVFKQYFGELPTEYLTHETLNIKTR